MDRDTLIYLLSSGKYLCFNPTEIEVKGSDEEDEEEMVGGAAVADSDETPVEALFDSPILRDSVFFKEVSTDNRTGLMYTSTRFLMAFNDENIHEGGASFEISGKLDQYLTDYYGGERVQLSSHDNCVLEVFNKTPTFDPFMLMSQRGYIQKIRSVGDKHFAVAASTATEVRAIISGKARQLVQLAANAGIKSDKINATALELEDAIWSTETNEGTSRVFQEMGIPLDQEDTILLAWKGISYYEYMLSEFRTDYLNMLSWLGSENSYPSDIGLMGTNHAAELLNVRERAKAVLRTAYHKACAIMRDYDESYVNLIRHQDPKPFHTFLNNAPVHFEQLGTCVGSFGHVNNAWKSLTNHGNYLRPKSDNMEKFYNFICDLISVPDSSSGSTSKPASAN